MKKYEAPTVNIVDVLCSQVIATSIAYGSAATDGTIGDAKSRLFDEDAVLDNKATGWKDGLW